MGKFKNGLLVTVSGAFAVGSLLLGTTYYNSNVKGEEVSKNKVKVIKTTETKSEKKDNNKIDKIFLNSKKIFLAKDISIESIEALEKESDELSSSEKKLLKKAKQKWDIQNTLNSMFETPVLIGDKYIEEAPVKEGVTADKLEKLNDKIEKLEKDDFKDKVIEIRMFLEGFIGYSVGADSKAKETEITETETQLTETETQLTETETQLTETQSIEMNVTETTEVLEGQIGETQVNQNDQDHVGETAENNNENAIESPSDVF
ncbi:hypothetical protein OL233_05800 [Vagococcus sp. PNs007]|uniref:MapZ extracellular domain-containing protein n=1 Tax=Vagococcus proximus TaxID=2991417 RepID=A0ABT5X1C6_9ENTE|nr:hypothetical protein [Vagococcus proximus]MDF0479800.1 hypothetical protein [Vagococcus proximus]